MKVKNIIIKDECGIVTEAGNDLVKEVYLQIEQMDILDIAAKLAPMLKANCSTCNGEYCKSYCFPDKESLLDSWERKHAR